METALSKSIITMFSYTMKTLLINAIYICIVDKSDKNNLLVKKNWSSGIVIQDWMFHASVDCDDSLFFD